MKTRELKDKIYKYNIRSEDEGNSVKFFDIITKEPVAEIYRDKMYAFTLCKRFDDYPAEKQKALFEIFCEYVKTPIDERGQILYAVTNMDYVRSEDKYLMLHGIFSTKEKAEAEIEKKGLFCFRIYEIEIDDSQLIYLSILPRGI